MFGPLGRLIDYARTDAGRKKLRYAGVAAAFVPIGQVVLQILGNLVFDRNFTKAAIVSSAILTLPNFFANKRFVWRDTNRENLRSQVVVFWIAAMLGLSFATLLTWLVEKAVEDRSAVVESLAVFAAQLVGYGTVWVGRFLILDRWLFRVTHHGEQPTEDELLMMHSDIPV